MYIHQHRNQSLSLFLFLSIYQLQEQFNKKQKYEIQTTYKNIYLIYITYYIIWSDSYKFCHSAVLRRSEDGCPEHSKRIKSRFDGLRLEYKTIGIASRFITLLIVTECSNSSLEKNKNITIKRLTKSNYGFAFSEVIFLRYQTKRFIKLENELRIIV